MKNILYIMLALIPFESWSICISYIDDEWPDYRYIVHNNETVTDTQTKLMWKTCTEGQSGSNCSSGVPTEYDWQQALGVPEIINNTGGFAGYIDWRVPNFEELRSLAAYNCTTPAINSNVFPNIPNPSGYWSSTPYRLFDDSSWAVEFSVGSDFTPDRDRIDGMSVRLVRTIL